MELRQLKQVLVLAETLNFHRAAERLHMAQPPLSTSIRKLEEELGVTLFDRLPTGLRLTPAGEVVLRNARRALFYSEELRRAAREGEAGEQGLLRLGFVGSATYSMMPQLIRSYRRQYPGVDLTIEESTTAELLRRLEHHSLDVALVRYPVLEPTDAQLTLLQHDNFMLAVSADSPLAARAEVALASLADEPFIMYSRAMVPSMYTLITHALHEVGVKPRIAQHAVQVQTILSLVESGLGVALVPGAALRYSGDGVRLLPLTDWPARQAVGIALATLPDAVTATAANFIALARTLVPAAPD
ncbi:LysR family transcriptional regulator [Cupriavidus alkaliphilus]|uniref:LysR family transcriptional regulator n=1 Tax=Cupriavidus alkaliphilus TaxID=942866 RepID=UPI0016146EED|nr:LysR family transcriptional regulator [Cupriavidus alkaliphilus]MBB2919992.1 DNA-binding transcriptional LysR family regulator [Cupriavidus alkaliphilus]MBB3013270.1 DNA-binding transcriptional LysR family regulator [Cupriavidus alkaliphilus]